MRTDGDARVLPLSDRTDGIRVDENGTVTLPDGTVLRYYRVGDLKNSGAFGLRGKNTGDLSTLSDASSMVSCMATLRDILCDGSLRADSAEQEAARFRQIIEEAAKIAALVREDAETEELLEAMGGLMDALAASDMVGEETAAQMMTAILQSPRVTEATGFTMKEAAELSESIRASANEEGGSYGSTMMAVSKAVGVVRTVNDENMTDEERRARIMELMEHLTPASASALQKMATANLMKSFGVPEKNAKDSAEMAGSLFCHLADYAKDHNDYEREADAVNQLFHMALSCKENKYNYAFSDPQAGRTGRTGKTAYAFVQSLTESAVVGATMDDVLFRDGTVRQDPLGLHASFNETDRQELADALRQYETEHPTAEVRHRLECIAALTNVAFVSGK